MSKTTKISDRNYIDYKNKENINFYPNCYSDKKNIQNQKNSNINKQSIHLNKNEIIANNLFTTKENKNSNKNSNEHITKNNNNNNYNKSGKDNENKFITVNDIMGEKCDLNLDIIKIIYNNYDHSKTSKKKMGLVKSYGVNTYKGLVRNYNEDRVSIIINMNKPVNIHKKSKNWPKVSFFGIYDGHGGEGCSEYLRDHLHKLICEDNEYFPGNVIEAIKLGFKKAENNFMNNHALNEKKEIVDRSGSCAVVVIMVDKKIYIANVGDSRCILSMDNGKKFIEVTKDHKPNSPNEMKRIKKYGGNIYQTETLMNNNNNPNLNGKILLGPYRVFPGRLSVSRTIGDAEAKLEKFGGNPHVIISEPDIFYYDLDKNDIDFFILGCDGIFDQVSTNEVLDCAWMILKEKNHPIIKHIKDIHSQSGIIVDLIIKSALSRRSFDNVTCLFIALKELGVQCLAQNNPEKKENEDLNINNLNPNIKKVLKENKNASQRRYPSASLTIKDRNNCEKMNDEAFRKTETGNNSQYNYNYNNEDKKNNTGISNNNNHNNYNKTQNSLKKTLVQVNTDYQTKYNKLSNSIHNYRNNDSINNNNNNNSKRQNNYNNNISCKNYNVKISLLNADKKQNNDSNESKNNNFSNTKINNYSAEKNNYVKRNTDITYNNSTFNQNINQNKIISNNNTSYELKHSPRYNNNYERKNLSASNRNAVIVNTTNNQRENSNNFYMGYNDNNFATSSKNNNNNTNINFGSMGNTYKNINQQYRNQINYKNNNNTHNQKNILESSINLNNNKNTNTNYFNSDYKRKNTTLKKEESKEFKANNNINNLRLNQEQIREARSISSYYNMDNNDSSSQNKKHLLYKNNRHYQNYNYNNNNNRNYNRNSKYNNNIPENKNNKREYEIINYNKINNTHYKNEGKRNSSQQMRTRGPNSNTNSNTNTIIVNNNSSSIDNSNYIDYRNRRSNILYNIANNNNRRSNYHNRYP